HGQRTSRCGREDVVRREHQYPGLGLGLRGQRQMHSHLVTIEVCVERLTHQRVQLNGLTLDQLRLERLNTQAVQCRSTVEHHVMSVDDLFEHVPDLGAATLHYAHGGLDVLGMG